MEQEASQQGSRCAQAASTGTFACMLFALHHAACSSLMTSAGDACMFARTLFLRSVYVQ